MSRKKDTPELRELFLDGVREEGTRRAGLRRSQVTKTTVQGWLDRDPAFQEQIEAALAAYDKARVERAREAARAEKERVSRSSALLNPPDNALGERRRTPLLEAKLEPLLEALRLVGNHRQAADMVGISQGAVSLWSKKYPDIGRRIAEATIEGKRKSHRPFTELPLLPPPLRQVPAQERGPGGEVLPPLLPLPSQGIGESAQADLAPPLPRIHSAVPPPLRQVPAQERGPGGEVLDRAWAAMEASPDSPTAGMAARVGVSLETLRRRPAVFFDKVLGWQPYGKQLEVADAVRDSLLRSPSWTPSPARGLAGEGPGVRFSPSGGEVPRRIAVRSGNGVGKTAMAARIMLWVLRCWPESIVVTTTPTERQVKDLLWREARIAYQRSKVPLGGNFYAGQARWKIAEDRLALGVATDADGTEQFQGYHAPLMVFIADEASGVPPSHWEAIKGSALAGNTVILAIGNPTRKSGEFYDAFHKNAQLWRPIAISAFDTPNFQQGMPRMPGLVGPEGIEQARIEWGEGSAFWEIRVLGQFPRTGTDALLPLEWLEAAEKALFVDGPYALGVDVARTGDGETVLALMQGNRLVSVESWRGQDTMRTAGKVRECADTHPGVSIAIDDGGVGGGVVDRLREQGVAVKAVTFGARPDGRNASTFRNKVSED